MTADNYNPTTALTGYYQSRSTNRPARHWAIEKAVHDLAALGLLNFFEGPGPNPMSLSGASTLKFWLDVDAGITTSSGTLKRYVSGDATNEANWTAVDTAAYFDHLGGAAVTEAAGVLLATLMPANILAFGAKGDGVTNDTAALVHALAASPVVYFPAGRTYLLSAGTYAQSATLIGEDRKTTILKWANTSGNSSLLHFTGASNVVVKNMTIDGNKSVWTDPGAGTYGAIRGVLDDGYSLTVDDVDFINGRYVDIVMTGPTVAGESVRLVVDNCTSLDGWEGNSARGARFVSATDGVISTITNNDVRLSTKPTTYGRAGYVHDGQRNSTAARGSVYMSGNYFDNIGRGTNDTLGCCDIYNGADRVIFTGNRAGTVCGRFCSVKSEQTNIIISNNVVETVYSSDPNVATAYSLFGDLFDPAAKEANLVFANNICGTSDGYGVFVDARLARTVTISIASPGVVTMTGHSLVVGDVVRFTTDGALPTGITSGTHYYVQSVATDTFTIAATSGGAAINTSGSQSGTHSCDALAQMTNVTISNFTSGACGIAGIHFRNAGNVSISNPMIVGGLDGIAYSAIVGALSVTGGQVKNQTRYGFHGNIGVGANTDCDLIVKGTVLDGIATRFITMTAQKSFDIDAVWKNGTGAQGLNTAGVAKLSRVRGSMSGISTPISRSGTFSEPLDWKVDGVDDISFGSHRSQAIASGAITIFADWHFVDTEGAAASDDLDTINGGYVGRVVVLRAASNARDVVCKDGTGNLKLNGDFTMTHSEDSIALMFNGTNWIEMCRSDNAA